MTKEKMEKNNLKRIQELAGIKLIKEEFGTSHIDDEFYQEITHQTDGDVTEFVVISRAVNFLTRNNPKSDIYAETILKALEDLKNSGGQFDSNEFR